jgi:trehalose-6-phosphate synthase
MPLGPLSKFSKSLRASALIAGVVGVVTGAMAWYQAQSERRIDTEDVDRRARALAHQFSFTVDSALERPDADAAEAIGSRLEGYRRLIGYAVYRPDGRPVASAKAVTEFTDVVRGPLKRVLAGEPEVTETLRSEGPPVHVLATRLTDNQGSIQGVLIVLHDVSYIDERATARLTHSVFWILLVTLILVTSVVGITWLAYDRPLQNLANWMKRLRTENSVEAPPSGLPLGLLTSESDRLAASFRAARSTGQFVSQAVVRAEKVWTSERLRTFAIDCIGTSKQLVVVSSREPYMHVVRHGQPQVVMPPGGLVTALDPVLRSCGGLWVAHGTGDADRETVDRHGRITVPPGDARYTLRRIWLSTDEEIGFYGCCNEALWPLCLLAHERPIFRTSDWENYVRVNQRFAEIVLEEVGSSDAVVLVQDFQLALVPKLLKSARPHLRVGLFWHIPWPNPEAIRICPWRDEILRGMLGADLIGFHLPQFCNNFLDTVDRMLEARLDRDHLTVELKGRVSLVRPFPISVQNWSERGVPSGENLSRQIAHLKQQHNVEGMQIAVGVDRIDYTKGLPERFRAIAHFLEKYPQHRGHFTLVQLAAPSRTHIQRYRDHIEELKVYADKINRQFQTGAWKPIHLLIDQHDGPNVHAWLQMASVAIVSSLHDGMNLVAKEFVAAQESCDGVLILSEFAGAARELSEALVINPYDTEQFADAIHYAVEMPRDERQARMGRMRRKVEEYNVYRWAADFLSELSANTSGRSSESKRRADSGIDPSESQGGVSIADARAAKVAE